jgi:signal transduction histidine kinase
VADDFLGLRQLVNSLGREGDLRYAMILDLEGRVLTHTRINETGARYDDPLTRRALTTDLPLFQQTRSPQGEILYDFSAPIMVLNQRRAVARIGMVIGHELRLIRRTRNTILGLGVLTLVTGLVWAHFQSRRLTRPIQDLAEGARAVALGDLDHRINTRRQDEVGDLAEAFNRMAESLRARFEVDRELSSTLNFQTVLATLVRHAQRLCGADLAFLAYRERGASQALVAACAGSTGKAIYDWIIRAGQGRAGWVLSTGRMLPAPDAAPDTDPEEARILAEEGLVAHILVPVLLQQACVGVLGVGRREAGSFGPGAVEILQRLADQAAVALANALAYREIELLNLSLEAKVAERTRDLSEANSALEVSHRRLQALDRLKSEFVSNVSHELRTPLTAIRMAVDNLLDGVTGETTPALQRYLSRVKHNTDRLVRLITELLDLSRIEAGRIELRPTMVSVSEILQEVAEGLRPMAAQKAVELAVAPTGSLAPAFADRDKLQQVLINLVGNAVKFTPSGGRVSLIARQGSAAGDQGVEIAVEDTGEGFHPKSSQPSSTSSIRSAAMAGPRPRARSRPGHRQEPDRAHGGGSGWRARWDVAAASSSPCRRPMPDGSARSRRRQASDHDQTPQSYPCGGRRPGHPRTPLRPPPAPAAGGHLCQRRTGGPGTPASGGPPAHAAGPPAPPPERDGGPAGHPPGGDRDDGDRHYRVRERRPGRRGDAGRRL